MRLFLRSIRIAALLASTSLLTLLTLAQSPSDHRIVGRWEGTLVAGENQLRLAFNVHQTEAGDLTATLDSPDQGALGIEIASVAVEGDTVRFDIAVLGAFYEGRLDAERQTIEGHWQQSGIVLPVTLERVDAERTDHS